MMAKDGLEVTDEGVFVKWKPLIEVESRVEWQGGTPNSSAIVPGVDFAQLLKPHVNKRIKVTIEVLNES